MPWYHMAMFSLACGCDVKKNKSWRHCSASHNILVEYNTMLIFASDFGFIVDIRESFEHVQNVAAIFPCLILMQYYHSASQTML